jgi:hypothetical protein
MATTEHITTAAQLLDASGLGRCEVAVLKEPDVLSGGDLLPGFSLPAAEIFAM